MANEPVSDPVFDRERDIFARALDLPEAERTNFLQRTCGPDQLLSQRISALLLAHEGGKFLPCLSSRAPETHEGSPAVIGGLIDRYKLIRVLGEGGCGIVYTAEQEEPVRRQVALKVIKAGMGTKNVIARFEAERQALAMMDHSNIAKVFDAGSTEAGRPYFVMELVEGLPITQFCGQNNLSIHQRLSLFLQVCAAVQHAHQKGIIHRDLKPSNILVSIRSFPSCSSVEDSAIPKVIDFGIAKAIEGRLTDHTIHTGLHQFIGTPAYMSPEQADLSPDIDTRTDIYSLGVLLYELLTGKPPFDNHELLTAGLEEMRRIIREVEPARPSARFDKQVVGDNIRRLSSKSAIRDPRSAINSDLDCIVLKCLDKDRSRRYESASALAADIQRHLHNEPVLARPDSAAYRLQKFVRRHRAGSVAAACVLLAVLIGTAVSILALFREREARRQSDYRLKTALAFVDEVFTQIAPELRHLAGAASANQKLAQSGLRFVENLRDGLGDDPALRLAIARQLLRLSEHQNPGDGNTIGDYETGLKRAREALAILNEGSFDLRASTRVELMYSAWFAAAQCLAGLGRMDEAAVEWRSALPLLDQLETFPEHARLARRNRVNIQNNSGYALVLANRPRQAIDEYLLPALGGAWVKQVSTNPQTATPDELEVIANLHDSLANAYLFLEQFDQMLPLREPATNLWNHLTQRHPRNGAYAAARAECLALHGGAFLATGLVNEGLALLDSARQIANDLVEKDNANDRFLYARTIIAAVRALAFAHWSSDRSSPVSERGLRFQQAEAILAEAEQFALASKTSISTRYLESARILISRAKALLERENRTPP